MARKRHSHSMSYHRAGEGSDEILGGAKHQVHLRSRLIRLLMRSFFPGVMLIADFERRRVFRPILAPIVEAGGRDIGVT